MADANQNDHMELVGYAAEASDIVPSVRIKVSLLLSVAVFSESCQARSRRE